MSHFYALVLLNPDQIRSSRARIQGEIAALTVEDLEEAVKPLLAPYDENTSVEEYDKACYCIGSVAKEVARRAAEQYRPFEELREEFNRHRPVTTVEEMFSDERQAQWKAHTKTYFEVEETVFNAHPLRLAPDASCKECGGAGTVRSTYNPKSKWDCYVVGGRWTGVLSDYDPEKDPANIEECDLCRGTGRRDDDLGRETRAKNPSYTCNGCGGEGKHVKWSYRKGGAELGNAAPAREVLREDAQIPFAIVTPDGAWNQRGEMGWWGLVRDEKDKDDWKAQARRIIEAHAECIAVVVDCHI